MWIRFDENDRATPAPDFCLPGLNGTQMCLQQRRGWSNLVLVFAHGVLCSACREGLAGLAEQYKCISDLDTEIWVIFQDAPDTLAGDTFVSNLPFPVLSDEGHTIHGLYASPLFNATPDSVMVFVLDRFGAPYVAWVGAELEPQISKALEDWLNYIEIQCPE